MDKDFVVHFVKRLGKVKVNYIVVIAIQKTLDDVVNVFEEMSEAAATFTKPVLLILSSFFNIFCSNFQDMSKTVILAYLPFG